MERWSGMTMGEMTAVANAENALDNLSRTWRLLAEGRGQRFLFGHFTRPLLRGEQFPHAQPVAL
jgi:hypothetical protein